MKIGGEGLISIEDCVNQAAIGLLDYIKESNEKLIIAVRRDINSHHKTCKEFRRRRREQRLEEAKPKTTPRSIYEGDGWNNE